MIWKNLNEEKPKEGKLLFLILKDGRIKKGYLLNEARDEWVVEGFKEMLYTDGGWIKQWGYVEDKK